MVRIRPATWVVVLGAGLLLGGGCRRRPPLCPTGTAPMPGRATEGAVWCQAAEGGRTFLVELYPGGQPLRRQSCPFLNGRLEGPYEAWHRDGKTSMTGTYAHARRHGLWRQVDETGKPVAEGQYRDGQLIRGAPVGVSATCEAVKP